MAQNSISGDFLVSGNISARTMTPIANSVNNASIPAGANVDGTKLGAVLRPTYGQPNTAATSERRVIHRARGDGTILEFNVGSIAIAVGAATVTFDLKKNGVTALTGVVTLDSGNTAFVAEAATLSGGAVTYVDGDVFDITTVATAGGGTLPTGIYAQLVVSEAPTA